MSYEYYAQVLLNVHTIDDSNDQPLKFFFEQQSTFLLGERCIRMLLTISLFLFHILPHWHGRRCFSLLCGPLVRIHLQGGRGHAARIVRRGKAPGAGGERRGMEGGRERAKTDKSTFSTVSNKRSLPPLRARLFAVATGHSCCLCLTADEGKKPLPNTQLCNLVIRLSALTPVLYLPFPLHRQNMLRIENWRMLFR